MLLKYIPIKVSSINEKYIYVVTVSFHLRWRTEMTHLYVRFCAGLFVINIYYTLIHHAFLLKIKRKKSSRTLRWYLPFTWLDVQSSSYIKIHLSLRLKFSRFCDGCGKLQIKLLRKTIQYHTRLWLSTLKLKIHGS